VASLTTWQRVQLSRHPRRPYTLDYVERLCTDWTELHGDRRFADDGAIVAGLARLAGRAVAVIGHQKGRSTKENMARRFGMPSPEGYRKARRVMELAARVARPVLTFIDTPGAYPGIGAEERGQAEAIAANLEFMARLPVPIVTTVIGEGGSGGALAIGVADRILMLEFATYSVISPEGCASILWRDAARAPEAAEAMRVTAPSIKSLGIADELVPEAEGGAHVDPDATAASLGKALGRHLDELAALPKEDLLDRRYRKLRVMGEFDERR
jgi:acetyl-CoA carboxylase carboxyl transferase subunit alpha